jgi:hypothetical protein
MKLNIYINNLIRKMEKKIGKKETREKLGVTRKTVFCWKKNQYDLGEKQLELVCAVASKVLEEDFRMLLMDGLIRSTEDAIKRKELKELELKKKEIELETLEQEETDNVS